VTGNLVNKALSRIRPTALGPAGWVGVIVTLAACAIDPAVSQPYLTPKVYALLLASGVLLLWTLRTRSRSGGPLYFTALEAFIAAGILWGVMVNPHWLATREGNWFWPSLAGLILTVVVRQLRTHSRDQSVEPGEPPPRTVALGDLMIALSIVGSLLAMHGLAGALAAGGFQPGDSSSKTSVISVIGTPNGFGAFMAAGIIGAVSTAAQARRRTVRLLLGGAALLQFGALIGNGSRGALLGLLAAGLLVFARARRGGGCALVAGALAAIPLAGILLYQLNPDSGRGRLQAWEISGAMLADRPLTGVGTGRFGLEYGRYQAELWRHPDYAEFDRKAVTRWEPNSELFHLFAERGLPGGLLYVLLWVFALGFLLNALRRNQGITALDWGLLALLIAILVHSLIDTSLHWVATLVTAHLALGLVPAPVLLRLNLGQPWVRRIVLAVGIGWAVTVGFKTAWEYPGYQFWAQATRSDGAVRMDLLERANRRLPAEPSLSYELGIGLLEDGQPEWAASVLQRGLDELEGPNIRLALAEAQLELGWLEPAKLNARTVAASYPDRLRPRLLLAQIHHADGEDAQARAALASCIRRDTYYRSVEVDSVVTEATQLWRSWYDDEPPR
jgi:hypothetical protein